LLQAGFHRDDITDVFLTHLHSDHVVGLPDLWMMGWMASRQEGPLNIWGPKGTNNMVSHLQQAFSYDTHIRQIDMHLDPRGAMMKANEVEDGVIFEKGGVVVRAIRVDHGKVEDAFGYRLDYQGYSVALSVDTRKNDNLANKAKGVDVMFHAVMAPRFYGADKHPIIYDKVRVRHTIPKEAGQIFAAIDPRLAVIYHRNDEPAAEVELLRDTRAQFRGDLRLAEDLMVIEIGKELKVSGGKM
ncbi:MAG: MBL fold metallo-hydrolase, partial [Psychrosphaera sp.]|nr:MBL fold metallo-hydrolase [Psychrosphaera sp.]